MGRLILVRRLAARDLWRRRGEAAMLLSAMMTATTALALSLAMRGVTAHPYESTRAATAGPDVLVTAFPFHSGPAADPAGLADVAPLAHARGVTASSGPYPVAFPVLSAHGHTDAVLAEGRDPAPAAVDQPKLTDGGWIRGGVVVERSFADALGIHTGDRVTLNGRPFRVAGIAVTAALPASGIGFLEGSTRWPNPGLIWLPRPAVWSLATPRHPLGYLLNLKLAGPGRAEAFANAHDPGGYTDNTGNPYLIPWQEISQQDGLLVKSEQKIFLVGSWLLALLAAGTLTVLAGGRMAGQVRRVGLLKAIGGTPALVAAILLAEHLALALAAAAAGLMIGRLAAPLLTGPGAGLLGTAGVPQITPAGAGIVAGMAVAVAAAATFVPAIRAARTSTIHALADAPRQPRRRAWLIRRSARLPVPLLLAARLTARQPRRVLLSTLSIAITVSGIVAVTCAHAVLAVSQPGAAAGSANPSLFDVGFVSRAEREDRVLLILTIMLIVLAAVNAIFISRATVQDFRHTSAAARALGATPGQLACGLSAVQVIPALAGAVLGVPAGMGLFTAASQGGETAVAPAWEMAMVVLGTVAAVAVLTFAPARTGARGPVAGVLDSEAP